MSKTSSKIKKEKRLWLWGLYIKHKINEEMSFEDYCSAYHYVNNPK